jgi:hypothetical protein
MRASMRVVPSVLLTTIIACGGTDQPTACCATGSNSIRVVNAFTLPVDVLVDGSVVIPSLTPGAVDTAAAADGSHSLSLRPVGPGVASTRSITTASGALSTIAAVRSSSGTLGSAVLDDTNSVVPAGATKVRVLHLAPNAGTIQVYRTQPDFHTPVSWQFPFDYQADPTPLSAPFFQSTVGTWEIHVWQTPADSTGWDTAPIKIVLPLQSGEKRTVIILDKPGGGIRYEVL